MSLRQVALCDRTFMSQIMVTKIYKLGLPFLSLGDSWHLDKQVSFRSCATSVITEDCLFPSLQKQTDFPPVALRRRKILSAKPSRKTTSLTSQALFQQ